MKFISRVGKLLVAALSYGSVLSGLGNAAAVPSSNVTLSSRVAAPYVACTPTGPGYCNLGVIGTLDEGRGLVYWQYLRVYDSYCRVIGGIDSTLGDFRADSRYDEIIIMYSQLPWSILIGWLKNEGHYNYIAFKYAAYSFGGSFACANRNGINVCQHAFPCA